MEKQGCQLGGFGKGFDLADEYRVIAGKMLDGVGHFEGGATGGQYRSAAGAGLPSQTGKTVGRPGGEAVGDVLLTCGQNVDRVMAGLAKGFQIVRSVVQTPEHERRLQRDCGKRIDCQTNGMAVRVDGRNDGNAGGKAAKGVAQGAGIWLG